MTGNLIMGILSAIFFALTVGLGNGDSFSSLDKFLAPPPEHLELFHFGFRESMADSFWLRWIQDSDVCQSYSKEAALQPQSEDKNPLTSNPRHKVCDNSWGFKMLDTTTRLAPKFIMAYWAGASSLSILVEDYEGATKLYERGLKEFPNDWILLYRASYHYQFDRKDLPRAAELLIRASERGGPYWLKSLAARLYTAAGQLELGLTTLETYRKTLDNEEAIKKVDERIAELRRQLQP